MSATPAHRTLATGLGFPEGPVFVDGQVLFTEIRGQRVARWRDGDVASIARTGGGANGLARDRDGALYVANNGGLNVGPEGYWHAPDAFSGRIQAIAVDGTLSDLVADFSADTPRPNDICIGPDGLLYFTDPRNWDDLANLKPGRLWRCARDGSGLEQLAEIEGFCNGIAFRGDELFVARSIGMDVLAFPWSASGVGDPRTHARLEGGFPDGMSFARDGSLYVCGSMGHMIGVFDPDGAERARIECPNDSEPTNCCIGDDGVLYVTFSGVGELVAFDLEVEALPLFD